MKKLFILFTLSLLAAVCLPAQGGIATRMWRTVGGGAYDDVILDIAVDSTTGYIYATGRFKHLGNQEIAGIGWWDGTVWHGMNTNTNDSLCRNNCIVLNKIAIHGGKVFGNGIILSIDSEWFGFKNLYSFDGTRWDTCGAPNGQAFPQIINGDLYIAGNFTSIGGEPISHAAKWNGTKFEAIGGNYQAPIGRPFFAIEFYKGDTFFAGDFEEPNGFKEIMSWDGNTFHSLNEGILGEYNVLDLETYKGLLYVSGSYWQSSGNAADHISVWNGSQWLPAFENVQFMGVNHMEEIGGKLYLAGYHFVFDGVHWRGPFNLARYDGSTFCSFGGIAATGHPDGLYTAAMTGYGDKFYIAHQGNTLFGDTVNQLLEYIGTAADEECIPQSPATAAPGPVQANPLLAISPNPATDHIDISLYSKRPATVHLTLHDLRGSNVRSESQIAAAGNTQLRMELEGLAAGLYMLEVQHPDGTGHGKVLKR